jgi:outer membrane protein insertion porin family
MNLFLTICLAAALSSFGSQDYQEEQLLPDLEGYKLAELKITGASPFSSQVLRDIAFSIKAGDAYDSQIIEDDMKNIKRAYNDMGFIDFTYTPQIDINQKEKTVSCSFRFVPGEQFFVNQINILGIKSSEEEVEIRSDIFFKEKYPFSLNAFYQSIGSVKAQLEGKGSSIKDFRYERLTDNPGKVDIFIQIESEKH